jgi:serine/threonine protein kinase
MNDELTPDRSIPLALKRRIDDVCDDFEHAWKRGETPALESFADRVEPAERPRLLRELIPIEVHYRRSHGERAATESLSLSNGCVETRDASAPRRLGQFELVECVGTGSFGTVWKARDTLLDRTVAIKIPRKAQLSVDEVEKFIREARSAAQLRHPNIVSVHDFGRSDGSIYIVSDFVQGVPLSKVLADRRLSETEGVDLAIKIADALHHAHEAGVIHRDLKPSNIMIDDQGEPHLTDFGLAKREAAEATVTLDGIVLGTPAFMSPEQARGGGHAVDRRTDIYSLGTVLFQMLTGELPFRGTARMLLDQVVNDDAPSPRRIDASIPKDLETICLKCLQKEPVRRYASAKEVVDDLKRFLGHEPISARPLGRHEKVWRWCKRRPAVAALTGTLILLLAVIAVAAYVPAVDKAPQENEATHLQIHLFAFSKHGGQKPSPEGIAEDDWLQARFTNGTPGEAVSVKLEHNGKIVNTQSGTIGVNGAASLDILVPKGLLLDQWTPVEPGRLDVVMAHGGEVTRRTLQLREGPRLLIKPLDVHEGSYMYFAIRNVAPHQDVNVTVRYDSLRQVREQTWPIGRTDRTGQLDIANSRLLAPTWITSDANEDGIDVIIDVGDENRAHRVCLKKGQPARI